MLSLNPFHGDAQGEVDILTPGELNLYSGIYDGQKVTVRGWIEFGFERTALWDSEEAMKANQRVVPTDCIGMGMSVSTREEIVRLNNTDAIITGVFQQDYGGPRSFLLGACNSTGITVEKVHEVPAE